MKNKTRKLSMALAGAMLFTTCCPSVPFAYAQNNVFFQEMGISGAGMEDVGGLKIMGAEEESDGHGGKQLRVSLGWNNKNKGHAAFSDAQTLFGRGAFTLLANVKADSMDANDEGKSGAFSIGTEDNNLHLFNRKGEFGYGSTKSGGGVSKNRIALDYVDMIGWNTIALVYEETGETARATIYLNGKKAGEVKDLGFCLSQMKITANVGRSFSTSYLLNGCYDEIVVLDHALSSEEAKVETASRLQEIKDRQEVPTYDSFSGTAEGTGSKEQSLWLADDGTHIQAHGGQVQSLNEMQVQYDLNGDGVIEDRQVWLWYGENKLRNGKPIDGVNCYVSEDLYNWKSMGTVLQTHDVVPAKIANSGDFAKEGVALDEDALEQLKTWTQMDEESGEVSPSKIEMARNFLEAYVDENSDTGYDEENLKLAFWNLYSGYCIVERPKMIYNEATGKYVLIYHQDAPAESKIKNYVQEILDNGSSQNTGSRYSRASMGFAVSDTPFGPFRLVNVQRMNGVSGQGEASKLGMARDMNVFVDNTDVDHNGVADAYVFYSSEENAKMYVSLLNADYTGPATEGTQDRLMLEDGTKIQTFATRILPDNSREAPAVFKYDGYYYMITSGTSGWNPNPATYYRAENIFGPWEAMGDPCEGGSSTTFRSQSTSVIAYRPEAGQFIYLGDRWRTENGGSAMWYSSYVYLPIQITGDHRITIKNVKNWNLEMMEELAPIKVNTELPDVIFYNQEDAMPSEVNVTIGSVTEDVVVSWEKPQGLGEQTLIGTIEGSDKTIQTTVQVLLDRVDYFVDCGTTSEQEGMLFDAIAAYSSDTMKNPDTPDQAYESGSWGYGTDSSTVARANGSDSYETLRYQKGGNNRDITYHFDDLEAGTYEVFAGFFDPWASSAAGKRVADVSLEVNGTKVGESVRHTIGEKKDLVELRAEVNAGDDLVLRVSPVNSGSNTDVQISFVAVRNEAAEIPEVEEYTTGIEVVRKPNRTDYYVGETFDPTGMKVEAIRIASDSNAVRETLSSDEYEVDCELDEPGEALVTVSHEARNAEGELEVFQDSFTVHVVAAEEFYTKKIRIDRQPDKRVYLVGETFDPEGMKVTQVMAASPSNAVFEKEIDTDELEYVYDFSKPGNQTVKVIFEGLDKNQEEKRFFAKVHVQVADEVEHGSFVDRIEVTSLPKKTRYYLGEALERDGLEVTAYLVDESTGQVSEQVLTDYRLSPTLLMRKGNVTITASYLAADAEGVIWEFTDTFEVYVRDRRENDDEEAVWTVPTTYPSSVTDGGMWSLVESRWRYTKPDGKAAANEWVKIGKNWYFFTGDGLMASSQWVLDGTDWYYVGTSGAMLTDTTTPDGYRVDKSGRWMK